MKLFDFCVSKVRRRNRHNVMVSGSEVDGRRVKVGEAAARSITDRVPEVVPTHNGFNRIVADQGLTQEKFAGSAGGRRRCQRVSGARQMRNYQP